MLNSHFCSPVCRAVWVRCITVHEYVSAIIIWCCYVGYGSDTSHSSDFIISKHSSWLTVWKVHMRKVDQIKLVEYLALAKVAISIRKLWDVLVQILFHTIPFNHVTFYWRHTHEPYQWQFGDHLFWNGKMCPLNPICSLNPDLNEVLVLSMLQSLFKNKYFAHVGAVQ